MFGIGKKDLKNKLECCEANLSSSRAEVRKLERQNARLQEQIKYYDDIHGIIQEKNAKIQKLEKELREQSKDTQIETVEHLLCVAENIEHLKSERDNLKAELHESIEETVDLQHALANVKADRDNWKASAQTCKKKLIRIGTQNATLKEDVSDLRYANKSWLKVGAQNVKLRKEIAPLERENYRLKKEITNYYAGNLDKKEAKHQIDKLKRKQRKAARKVASLIEANSKLLAELGDAFLYYNNKLFAIRKELER